MQLVRRFNVPDPDRAEVSAFQIDVRYSAGQIEVDDLIDVDVTVRFTPPEPIQAAWWCWTSPCPPVSPPTPARWRLW